MKTQEQEWEEIKKAAAEGDILCQILVDEAEENKENISAEAPGK